MAKQRNPKGAGSYRKLKDGRVAWRQTIDGQTREISARTPKELQTKIKEIADLPIIKEKYLVMEWFVKWLRDYVEPLKKQATYDQYRIIYEQHIEPEIGKRKMMSIKSSDIQKVITEMNKKGLSTWTMKHARKVMNIAFQKAVKDKIIPANPVQDIEIPQKQKKPKKILSTEELAKLFDSMKNSRWIWAVKFALVTGLRRGELLAIEWKDINWKDRSIIIKKSNSATGEGDTKEAVEHFVPLSNKAIYYLECQLDMLKSEMNPIIINERNKIKKDLGETSYLVFPAQNGQAVKPNTFYNTLKRYGRKAGVHVHPHCLRHTFVYFMRHKLSLKQLQDALGHEESTSTLDLYGNILGDTEETSKQIDDVFEKIENEIMRAKNETVKKEIKSKTSNIILFPGAKKAR